eukprot:gene6358-7619_t
MLADDVACNPRNPHPGKVFNNADQRVNIYGDDIEVVVSGKGGFGRVAVEGGFGRGAVEGGFSRFAGEGGFGRVAGEGGFGRVAVEGGFSRFAGEGGFGRVAGEGGFSKGAGEDNFGRVAGEGGFGMVAGEGGFSRVGGEGGFGRVAGEAGFSRVLLTDFFGSVMLAEETMEVPRSKRLLTRNLVAGERRQVPRSKRLLTDSGSNVLIFLTGHGGEEFLKFQDSEEILSRDIADAVGQMHNKARYHEMLFMVDTCQGASLFNDLSSPGIITLSSSASGESSYSHHIDFDVGVSVIDRFSFYMLEFFERVTINSHKTVADLFRHFRRDYLRSTPTMSTKLYNRPIDT